MTQAELKDLTESAIRQAYSAQVISLYNVLGSKIITARGSGETQEATSQFQRGLELAKATYIAAARAV